MSTVLMKDLSKIYAGGVRAVDRVNVEVKDKDFVILVGPSGCGKTTTLRMVAGLEEISEGDLFLDGRQINTVPAKDRDMAMVFQNYALYPHMSVFDNMAFGLKLKGVPRSVIEQRVNEAAEMLSLREYLQRKPRQLSGGQRQRVALGRAIVRKPRVFLFDEPLSNLDAKLRVETRGELMKLHLRLQSTMIYVTHDQVEAMTMGTRIVVMKDGVVHQNAPPMEIYERPANTFVAGFIGSPAMNFLPVTAVSRDGRLFFERDGFSVRATGAQAKALEGAGLSGRDLTLGIRPEHVHDKVFVPDAALDRIATAVVEVVESMGAETHLYMSLSGHPLCARVSPEESASVNQELELVFDMGRSHLFDGEGKRIPV